MHTPLEDEIIAATVIKEIFTILRDDVPSSLEINEMILNPAIDFADVVINLGKDKISAYQTNPISYEFIKRDFLVTMSKFMLTDIILRKNECRCLLKNDASLFDTWINNIANISSEDLADKLGRKIKTINIVNYH